MAENIIALMNSCQENKKWEFKPYNDRDMQKELTEEEIKEINKVYMSHKSLMSFPHIKQVMFLLIILVGIFVFTYEIGNNSATSENAIYQTIEINEKPYVVLEKCDDFYIVASITESHKENRNILNIEILNQLIVETSNVKNYQIESFDEINLEK